MVLSLNEVFSHPAVQELSQENDFIQNMLNPEQKTRLAMLNVENIKLPYIVKDKLLMADGTHNGWYYSKGEIENELNFSEEESFNLICDHSDTISNTGVANYAGIIKNRRWDDAGANGQGPGVYGDLHIMDANLAKKHALGAKWGISPTYNFDEASLDGQQIATNLGLTSYSLVLDPAVRKTMLNNSTLGGVNMNGQAQNNLGVNNQGVQAGAQGIANPNPAPIEKKLPYQFPYPTNPELHCDIEVNEGTLAILKDAEEQIKGFKELKDQEDTKILENQVDIILSNEFLMGMREEKELEDRKKELLEKSSEVLIEVGNVIGNHEELSAFTDFAKAYKLKNPNAGFKEIGTAWKAKGNMNADPDTNDVDDLNQLITPNPNGDGRTAATLARQENLHKKYGINKKLDQSFANVLIKEGNSALGAAQ